MDTRHEDGLIMRRYLTAVSWCLAHRKATLIGAVLFFAVSVAMIPLIPSGLVPPADTGYTTVSIELPPGSSIGSTLKVSEATRTLLREVPGVERIMTTVGDVQSLGGGESQAGEVRKGALLVKLKPRGARSRQILIEHEIRDRLLGIPGARFTVGSGGAGEKLQIIVRPDFRRAAERGVTTRDIGDLVRIATSGDFDAQIARLNLNNRQVYIRARLANAARADLDTLANLRVNGRDGAVPLSSIATLSMENGPSQIDRYDRHRYVTVDADLGGMALGTAIAAAEALPAVQQMPSSVKLIQSGDAENANELASGFAMALLVGVFCVYCVLVLLFKDFLQPVTILSAIPLSLGGAFLALLLLRSELDVPSMIGLVMLMGVVTKNSILLIEFAMVAMRDRHLSMREALMDACHKRARPIVMTTVAMIAGMLPIALGLGADASFRQPMAVAVSGGLLTSTALSLLVVPVVFSLLSDFEHWIKRQFGSRRDSNAVAMVS
jgi:multidrug efflux pump subunit AcrB